MTPWLTFAVTWEASIRCGMVTRQIVAKVTIAIADALYPWMKHAASSNKPVGV